MSRTALGVSKAIPRSQNRLVLNRADVKEKLKRSELKEISCLRVDAVSRPKSMADLNTCRNRFAKDDIALVAFARSYDTSFREYVNEHYLAPEVVIAHYNETWNRNLLRALFGLTKSSLSTLNRGSAASMISVNNDLLTSINVQKKNSLEFLADYCLQRRQLYRALVLMDTKSLFSEKEMRIIEVFLRFGISWQPVLYSDHIFRSHQESTALLDRFQDVLDQKLANTVGYYGEIITVSPSSQPTVNNVQYAIQRAWRQM
ncbi:hypothetical protein CANCADRAFT_101699 [Tortispora caseinolytica NRRL Y-17796]|uniref:Uncharacterized protein n=1 Tax=Tortispora caseinolytica NRRL Y-17796 TaxID=767744 RepID=A0A1E4TEL9_9ASCO|nr:hypothetical protein CANCADRAFT_101699 [Tortispora caseinolytica NRRL Y-17796]